MRMNAIEWLKKSPHDIQGPLGPDELSTAESVQRILRDAVNASASLSDGQQIYITGCLMHISKSVNLTSYDLMPLITCINSCK